MRHVEHDDRSNRLDLRARDADGGSYRRRVAERLPRSTSLALGPRCSEEELHLVPAGRRGAARVTTMILSPLRNKCENPSTVCY
jgi:hypothetical protein